jgi:hypothetical protein
MTKQKKFLRLVLIFLLIISLFFLGGITNAYLTYIFNAAPKYAKVRTDFAIFARETFISTGDWPQDVEDYKNHLIEKGSERLFAYVVFYEVNIKLLSKTETHARYLLTFSSSYDFEIIVEK